MRELQEEAPQMRQFSAVQALCAIREGGK
jgi:hypothetical protein